MKGMESGTPRRSATGQLVFGSVGLYALLYNTNLVKGDDIPKSWKDITDPKWQGKILSDDLRAAGAGNVFFEATLNAFGREFHYEKPGRQQTGHSAATFPKASVASRAANTSLYIPFNVSEYTSLRGLPIKAVPACAKAAPMSRLAGRS